MIFYPATGGSTQPGYLDKIMLRLTLVNRRQTP